MTDRIEKTINLKAPLERVWRALTDHIEFGQWFGVNLDGPFRQGEATRGRITHPGYDHLQWEATVVAMEESRRFSFTWHPYAIESDVDYSKETPTTVDFWLEPANGGTRLTVVESGFDAVPAHRRDEAFRMNEGGWEAQMSNIQTHVDG